MKIQTTRNEGTAKRSNNEIVLCLCPICVQQFYNSPNHVVTRINLSQTQKGTCTYCDVRAGYDFCIIERKKRMGDDFS